MSIEADSVELLTIFVDLTSNSFNTSTESEKKQKMSTEMYAIKNSIVKLHHETGWIFEMVDVQNEI